VNAVGAKLVDRLGEGGHTTILTVFGSPLKLEFAGNFDIRLRVAMTRRST
jgi:hypothetical protein